MLTSLYFLFISYLLQSKAKKINIDENVNFLLAEVNSLKVHFVTIRISIKWN